MLNFPVREQDDLPLRDSPLSEENRKLRNYICMLEHNLFSLYVFLAAQDIREEACDFLHRHEEDPVPLRSQL